MSRANSTMLFTTSLMPGRTSFLFLMIGLGLGTIWLLESDKTKGNPSVPVAAAMQLPLERQSRSEKDDVFTSLPTIASAERGMVPATKTVASQTEIVPVPTILRKQGYVAKATIVRKDNPELARVITCLPGCESRDPLLAPKQTRPIETAVVTDNHYDVTAMERAGIGQQVADRGSRIVSGAVNASVRAFGFGKSAAVSIVDLVR